MATKKRTYKRRHRKKELPSRRRPSNTLILAGIVGAVFVLLVLGLMWRAGGGGTATDIAPPEVLAQGETVYQENCVACHGENGQGYIGPALNGSAHAWHHPDPLLLSFIRDGIPGTQMAAQGDNLTDEEINAVISYMKSWWTPQQRQMQQQGRH
ncbi:MAG: c-type cytochrome [Ardenticatenaceae bacterium]